MIKRYCSCNQQHSVMFNYVKPELSALMNVNINSII